MCQVAQQTGRVMSRAGELQGRKAAHLKVVKLSQVPGRLGEEVVSSENSHAGPIQGVDCCLACTGTDSQPWGRGSQS